MGGDATNVQEMMVAQTAGATRRGVLDDQEMQTTMTSYELKIGPGTRMMGDDLIACESKEEEIQATLSEDNPVDVDENP